ncbi:uncharacterized protein LOC129216557 [Uloborus diversus]|uniref:uncharacterized protein LOC129216557 n=1 Tax=Uloborus diversus TaxID=327109 RepID=UPI00240A9B2B|nr:uncharacterized protein LOC129216557 [Uloborus diversus]
MATPYEKEMERLRTLLAEVETDEESNDDGDNEPDISEENFSDHEIFNDISNNNVDGDDGSDDNHDDDKNNYGKIIKNDDSGGVDDDDDDNEDENIGREDKGKRAIFLLVVALKSESSGSIEL